MPVAGVRAMARALRPDRAFQLCRALQLRRMLRPGPAQFPARPPQPGRPPGGPARPRPLRAMLMTPWLAAGIGVVLAAALALHGPHTELTYTPANPEAPCTPDHCGAAVPGQGAGRAPSVAGPGTRLEHGPKAGAVAGPAQAHGGLVPVRRPLVVRYQTVRQWPGGFAGLITVTGQAVQASWQLTFRYPGAEIDSVTGAPWTVDGAEVTVTGGMPATPAQAARGVRIHIKASGAPSQPTGCIFNGVACSIH
jgi:hypothetical protein